MILFVCRFSVLMIRKLKASVHIYPDSEVLSVLDPDNVPSPFISEHSENVLSSSFVLVPLVLQTKHLASTSIHATDDRLGSFSILYLEIALPSPNEPSMSSTQSPMPAIIQCLLQGPDPGALYDILPICIQISMT